MKRDPTPPAACLLLLLCAVVMPVHGDGFPALQSGDVADVAAAKLQLSALEEELVQAEEENAALFLDGIVRDVVAGMSHPRELSSLLLGLQSQGRAGKCLVDVVRWAAALTRGKTWALQMLDATSKLITGVLYGNNADLGNFDECVTSTPGTLGLDDDFTGRFALPVIHFQQAVSPSPSQRVFLGTFPNHIRSHIPEIRPRALSSNESEWSNLISLQFAFCAPSSCEPRVLEAALQSLLRGVNKLTASRGIKLEAELPPERTSLYSGWRQPDAADWIMVGVCVIIAAVVFVATALDIAIAGTVKGLPGTRISSGVGLLLVFSVMRNGRRLLTVSESTEGSFTCVNGIRFFSSLWVILGHRYRYAIEGVPFTNLVTMPKRITESILVTIIPSGILSVDTFFLVGGMVNAYAFMRSVQKKKSFNIIEYYLHRYIRLTPSLLLIIGITSTWYSLLGNGPVWFVTAGLSSEHCRASWWTHPLYLANYINPDSQCVVTWYLMVDMQLHWLSPLVLVPLWKSRRLGVPWTVLLIGASCAVPFALSWLYEFRAPIPVSINDAAKQQREMDMLYYPTHMRATSYLVGLLVGYYLYLYRAGKFASWRLKTVHMCLGWLASTALCLTCIFGAQPLFNIVDGEYNKIQSSFFIGFYRLAWSVGISWVVLACVTGRGGPVNAILSWTPFMILGRLTYGIYLTHALVQFADVGTVRTSDYYSDFKMVKQTLSDACLATMLATILTLFLEAPISGVEKVLRAGKPEKGQTERPNDGVPQTLQRLS